MCCCLWQILIPLSSLHLLQDINFDWILLKFKHWSLHFTWLYKCKAYSLQLINNSKISFSETAKMDQSFYNYSLLLASFSLLSYFAGKFSYSLWWKPKLLEKRLKEQGIRGRPYKLLLGDIKEIMKMMTEAWSKPMNLNHQIVSRVDPFTFSTVQQYGTIWSNPNSSVFKKM